MEELIQKAKRGDTNTTLKILNKYKYFIFKEVGKYYIPGYNFEDLVQHGYLSVIKAINMYEPNSNSFNGYILNAISLNYKALLKGEIKHYREIPDNNILNKNKEYSFTIEEELIVFEEIKKLYEAIDKLHPLDSELIKKYYFENKKLKEFAMEKNLKYSEVVYRKKIALKKLRDLL